MEPSHLSIPLSSLTWLIPLGYALVSVVVNFTVVRVTLNGTKKKAKETNDSIKVIEKDLNGIGEKISQNITQIEVLKAHKKEQEKNLNKLENKVIQLEKSKLKE